jgi:hypothetical protein
MKQRGSVPIIILIVLILIFLALASGGFYLFQKERVRNLELQDSMEEIKTKQRITETKLKDSEKNVLDLQTKLKEAKTQIDALTAELQQEKQSRTETQSKLEQLSADLDQQKEARLDLETRLQQAQDETRSVQSQLQDLNSQKSDLEAKVKELEEKTQNIELGKIVVAPDAAQASGKKKEKKPAAKATPQAQEPAPQAKEAEASAKGGQDGKVLVVNKDYNFVVINLGSRDGIEVGKEFAVYNNGKYLGDVKVEKVHDAMAAAGFVTEGLKDKVSEGDKVIPKSK